MTPAVLFALLIACKNDNDRPADLESQAVLDVKTYTAEQLGLLTGAAADLQGAAPEADADGWTSAETATLEGHWVEARAAYERVEGAIAVLFPDLDVATDERYDGALAEGPDEDLFDDEGFVGVHAIERIVWADRHPAQVVTFEEGLPYYTPAAFPASEDEAAAFRELLCGRLVEDTAEMETLFEPLALDSAAAFRGVIGSMEEQLEKVALASTGEDESRYAQYTLGDMRANLDGGREIYLAFQPWLGEQEGGEALDAEILAGFDRVDAAYDAIQGDAVPEVPATWNPDAPSEEDLATAYGQLWQLVSEEADPEVEGSLTAAMGEAADLLGIPQLPE